MCGRALMLIAALSLACSAVILDDETAGAPSDDSSEEEGGDAASESGPTPHPLDGSLEVDCPDAVVSSNCAWTVASTAQSCELRCNFASPCEVLAVEYDHDAQSYIDPVDEGRLGCLLDTLGANTQAYLEWNEQGAGDSVNSETTYRAWLLRPEELILARWHESTVDGNIGPFGQSLTAVRYDATQLLDCQAETQGASKYECLLETLTEASCQGFGPATCE